MKEKKIISYIFIFVISLLLCDNVFADYFTCSAFGDDVHIDTQIAHIVRYVILILQIAAPILLVIFGTIDLVKGITSQKEDEIKSGQKIFIKRLISGALVFFVIAIVKFVVSLAAKGNSDSIFSCVNEFIK